MKLPQFQQYLKKQNIDIALFVHPDPTITYFTQMVPSDARLLITPNKASFCLSKLDQKPKLNGISVLTLTKNWEKRISNQNIKKVGINKEALTVHNLEKARKHFPKARFVDVSSKLKELRSQKTPEEMKKKAKACQITSKVFDALIKELPKKTLLTEQDVAFFIEKKINEKGAVPAFPAIVAIGKNTAVPHHVTSSQKLGRGFLLMDFGARYQNYCADMTRVVFLGKPTKQEKKLYQLLLETQLSAIESIKAGEHFHNLEKFARKNLGEYAKCFTHSLGHGIGIEVHEEPLFSNKENKVQKNLAFTIEPGIYFRGKFGLRIEDTVVFDGKVKVLTKASKKLVVI